MKYIFVSIFCISLLFSCQDQLGSKELEAYLMQATNSEKLSISSENDTAKIQIEYKFTPQLTNDFITSMAAITYLDTAKSLLEKAKLKYIKVEVINPNGTEVYNYPISKLDIAREGLEIASVFMTNFLNSKSEENVSMVDESIIKLEDLKVQNQVNEQLQSSIQIEGLTFDGFSSHLDLPYEMEYRGKLVSAKEAVPFVLHYNSNTKKFFYFALNE